MQTRLYVGNLNIEMTSAKLSELFSPFGRVVSARVMGEPGRSKSFGYVQMASEREAVAAIAGLSGSDQAGRSMIVQAAKTGKGGESAPALPEQPRGKNTRRDDAVKPTPPTRRT